MNTASSWKGLWTALVTPLKEDLSLDREALETLLEFQIQSGIRGFVIAGSTGEGSLLSARTRQQLFESTTQVLNGRAPWIAGLGIGGTEACLETLHMARKAGCAGVLASPPAYIKTPQEGLYRHYLRLAQEGLPVCLYEVPGRAASSLQDETIFRLIEAPNSKNIVALKDASGDLTRLTHQRQHLGTRLALLSGEDGLFAEYQILGGDGLISVAAHVVPAQLLQIDRFVARKELDSARVLQKTLAPLIEGLFSVANPIPIKSLLAALQRIPAAHFCLPLLPLETPALTQLQQHLAEAFE